MPKAEEDGIVDLTYAASDGGREYLELLEKAEETGECPFCPNNLPKRNEILADTINWQLIPVLWRYKNAVHHLLIIPKRHMVEISDILPADWDEIQSLIKIARERFPTLAIGGGLAIRFGTNSGVTIRHLHFHLIAPETNPETGKVYPERHVNFPIG